MSIPITNHLNHKPDEVQLKKIDKLRAGVIVLHEIIDEVCPALSPEKMDALKKLEEVRHWAVESIVLPCPAMEIGDRYKDTEIVKADDPANSQGDSH